MTETEPLDPAAIMELHADSSFTGIAGDRVCGRCDCDDFPCETYRLAEALAAVQEKVRRVEAVLGDPGSYRSEHRLLTVSEVRDALAGDDQ